MAQAVLYSVKFTFVAVLAASFDLFRFVVKSRVPSEMKIKVKAFSAVGGVTLVAVLGHLERPFQNVFVCCRTRASALQETVYFG